MDTTSGKNIRLHVNNGMGHVLGLALYQVDRQAGLASQKANHG
ncbi:hypothetical protein [Magnetococcus marinus]|nr:hypothetical protein [Magnetococcus marinus]